jgi:hypothetical protein
MQLLQKRWQTKMLLPMYFFVKILPNDFVILVAFARLPILVYIEFQGELEKCSKSW